MDGQGLRAQTWKKRGNTRRMESSSAMRRNSAQRESISSGVEKPAARTPVASRYSRRGWLEDEIRDPFAKTKSVNAAVAELK